MGGSGSKSPFDRRNSVERRTQRRVLFNIKDKIKKIEKDVKKFNGLPADDEYERLTTAISSVQKDLAKKHATLQPKNKTVSLELQREAEKYLETLVEKAKLNQQKQSESNNNREPKHDDEDTQSTRASSSEIRQTVELRLVKVEDAGRRPTSQTSSVRSPEETRKSIMKVGVPVMPNAAKELKRKVEQDKQIEEVEEESILRAIESVKQQVGEIELTINEFVGLKNGVRYMRIKEKLLENLAFLDGIANKSEIIVEEKGKCMQYIRSSLNFLDEKADEEEVFSSDNEDQGLPSIPPKGIKATLI